MASSSMKTVAKRISNYLKPTVFEELSVLSRKQKSSNLGQGYPDWETPKFLTDALGAASFNNENQYLRCGGHPELVEIISEQYSSKFNRKIDPMTEVSIANGASGAIANAFCAFLEEGDEVICLEPAFDFHFVNAEMYGGVVKFCPLTAPQAGAQEWKIDFEKLEKTFTDKTKMLTLISPHNPTGKIFTDEEIKKLITILNKYPKVIVLADEVYEHMLYTTDKLPRIGSYPGMWERTVTIYSLGKTFSCTGWRVGFSVGDEKLIKPIIASQQWLNFNVNRPAQVAMAHAMKAALKPYENYPDYYAYLNHLFKTKKDDLVDMLKSTPLDFKVYEPDGGYFVMTDISNSWDKIPMKYFYKHGTSKDNRPVGNDISRVKNPDHAIDYAFSYWMTYDVGVTPVPVSCFFDNRNNKNPLEHRGTNFLRFSMCKNDETLHAAREKLKNFKI